MADQGLVTELSVVSEIGVTRVSATIVSDGAKYVLTCETTPEKCAVVKCGSDGRLYELERKKRLCQLDILRIQADELRCKAKQLLQSPTTQLEILQSRNCELEAQRIDLQIHQITNSLGS